MLTGTRTGSDRGSISVLVIGYTAIAAVLVMVGVDASKVFLARRALAAAADAAALAAAQGVDRGAVYAAGVRCGAALPLDPRRAAALAASSVAGDRPDLRQTLARVDDPVTRVGAGTVSVRLSGTVTMPLGGLLGRLDPARPGGTVPITETSHARSPVAGGC